MEPRALLLEEVQQATIVLKQLQRVRKLEDKAANEASEADTFCRN